MNETPPKLADVLATERTRMAADRTLMGWIRTALSMIGFGFTIYKFLEPFSAKEGAPGIGVLMQHSPRTVGLTLLSFRGLLPGHRLPSTLAICKEIEVGSTV